MSLVDGSNNKNKNGNMSGNMSGNNGGNNVGNNGGNNVSSPYYSPPTPSSAAVERARIARTFFLLACLWPLLFLLIPPTTNRSHVALLATGMDTMDSQSLTQHMRHLERQTHDKIDKMRSKVSNRVLGNLEQKTEYLRREMKSLMSRTDVVGYGPSRPRVAVCIVVPSVPTMPSEVGHHHVNREFEEKMIVDAAVKAVESVFRTTDRNRIFAVTVVMDGRGKVGEFEAKLDDIDAGRTAHRHGDRVHTHDHHPQWKGGKKADEKKDDAHGEEDGEKEAHAHSEKIHAIYNHETIGTSASRKEAVQFVNILAKDHEAAGLKSPEEDLILLFLRCDARLKESEEGRRTWLDDVTDALILTPPEENGDPAGSIGDPKKTNASPESGNVQSQQLQPANAVSFNVFFSSTDREGNVVLHPPRVGDTLGFDDELLPLPSKATAQDMSTSNGESYPAPVTNVATALRLATYNAFPASDDRLANHYAADLELSFNLWMCADGIDILSSSAADVIVDPSVLSPYEKAELPGPLVARLVSAWMSGHGDDAIASGILGAVAKSSATAWQQKKQQQQDGGGGGMKDHTTSDRRELADKTLEMKNVLVRIASEAKQSDSFPTGLAKKCRPFLWYAANVHTKILEFPEGGMAYRRLLHSEIEQQEHLIESSEEESLLPSKPLDEARMAIVAKASPVKLAYVDASGGHVAHPHKGATDENGRFGYVHDETALRLDPPRFEFANDDEHARLCKKGDPNWKMLTEKVYVDLTNHEAAERRAEHGLARKKRAKIFCLVYTIEKYHDRIPAIRETWGPKCDGFMVASTKTDKKLGTVNIPHEGPEEYNNIWQKVRSMWSYIYDNYYEKYDYFHIGGDDLYLLVENLRLYLESEEIQLASNGGQTLPNGSEDEQTPLFMGRRFAEGGNRARMFISGGSGYTMNKAALKTLVVDGFPTCFPHMHTFSEDVMVATCLRKMDIVPYDTKDEAGGERYMPFQPGHHLTYHPPKNPKDDWYSNYSVDVKWGIDHCAAKSVAFHYIKEDLMKRMHGILYHYC